MLLLWYVDAVYSLLVLVGSMCNYKIAKVYFETQLLSVSFGSKVSYLRTGQNSSFLNNHCMLTKLRDTSIVVRVFIMSPIIVVDF